ncbi:MAG: hypothetical protein HY316_01570 [Acidobacteria bacterium]|nr:hypothetical protein [Acidobacteriota bacterium]
MRRHFCYALYGVTLRSQWELPFTPCARLNPPLIDLVRGSPALFRQAARNAASHPFEEDLFRYTRLEDGSSYLRWPGLYEFLIAADGSRIAGRPARLDIPPESFHTYLLGAALSVAMIRRGVDPLHATVVAANGSSFGLLGKSGDGKSTLAGAFLQAGYAIVSDDLLITRKNRSGISVYPGPPRIKLYPEAAQFFIGGQVEGTRMNPLTRKLIIPLSVRQSSQQAVPLKALYVLNPPSRANRSSGRKMGESREKVRIRRLSRRHALLALLEHTFNDLVRDESRLSHQFLQYAQIASCVPVKRLSYPRRLDALPAVRDAILADLRR